MEKEKPAETVNENVINRMREYAEVLERYGLKMPEKAKPVSRAQLEKLRYPNSNKSLRS